MDAKVGHSNVPDLARADELLHLTPRVFEVPIVIVLLEVFRDRGAGPVHQEEVEVLDAQELKTLGERLGDSLVPWVVELGSQPDLLAGNTRCANTLADLLLVAVGAGSVDVTVAKAEGSLDGLVHFIGLRLPGAQTDGGDLVAGAERDGAAGTVSDRGSGGGLEGSRTWSA